MSPHEFKYETALLELIDTLLAPGALADPHRRSKALQLLRDGYPQLSKLRKSRLRNARALDGQPPSASLVDLLRLVVGVVALHERAELIAADELDRLGHEGELRTWLVRRKFARERELQLEGLRDALGIATDQERHIIDARLGRLLRRGNMPIDYEFDPRGLPSTGFDEAAFKARIKNQLQHTVPELKDSMVNFVLGAMSLDGFLPQDTFSQDRHVRELRFESENTTKRLNGDNLLNRDAFELIAVQIAHIRIPSNGHVPHGKAYYEELAFVARDLISNAVQVPIDSNGLRERVANSLNAYVPGQSGGTLTLPLLDAQDAVSADLVADNVRAVGLVYASWNLEELKLFQVLDRVVEVFMNGQLPLGFDNGGRALSEYYFEDPNQRLTEAARRMTYSRVLGVPGGQVSQEAPPNHAYQNMFLRFLATYSEFQRQRRIADIVGTQRTSDLSLTAEQVRKAGRDLAANATLYGYGGTFFVAQKQSRQIEQALRILSIPEILSAYGVSSPFQVVERVCASDFGGNVPNVVRLRTMAQTGKEILDVVAANLPAWTGQSGQDLFTDPASDAPADIPPDVEDRLSRAVEHWLAVNGIKDDQRLRLGEPEVTAPSPSIPTATHDGTGTAAFDQLRQMISAGQAPSVDQIKALLPDTAGIGRM